MKIIRLNIEGFRSFRSQSWTPGELNVLIGPNASGKSNLLRALEALSLAAAGRLGAHVQEEGGIGPILWDDSANRTRLRVKTTPIPPYTNAAEDALTYELVLAQLGKTSAFRVEYEVLGNFCKADAGQTGGP